MGGEDLPDPGVDGDIPYMVVFAVNATTTSITITPYITCRELLATAPSPTLVFNVDLTNGLQVPDAQAILEQIKRHYG